MKESMQEVHQMVRKQLSENEVLVRKILLKGGGGGHEPHSEEMRALKEKNLLEYVDVMVKNVKNELKGEIEEEKQNKNSRLEEVSRLIQAHKGLTDEHIKQ